MGRGNSFVSKRISPDEFRPRICFLDVSYDLDSMVCDEVPSYISLAPMFKLQSSVSILVDHLHRLVGLIASDSSSDVVDKVLDKLRSVICLVGSDVCVSRVKCIFSLENKICVNRNSVSGSSSSSNCSNCIRSSSNSSSSRSIIVGDTCSNMCSNVNCGNGSNGNTMRKISRSNDTNDNVYRCKCRECNDSVDCNRGAMRENDEFRSLRHANPSRPLSCGFPLRFDLNCLKSCAKVCCAKHLFDLLVDENVVLVYRQTNHVFSRIDGFYALPPETVCSLFRERVRDLYRRYCGVFYCDEKTGCSVRDDGSKSRNSSNESVVPAVVPVLSPEYSVSPSDYRVFSPDCFVSTVVSFPVARVPSPEYTIDSPRFSSPSSRRLSSSCTSVSLIEVSTVPSSLRRERLRKGRCDRRTNPLRRERRR